MSESIKAGDRVTAPSWNAAEQAFADEYATHMSTWGPNCGAPKSVYEGHLKKLLEAQRKAINAKVRERLGHQAKYYEY